MQLYNTASKEIETVETKPSISLYTCGPTVYLDPHIGNWRMFIVYDLLSRALQLDGRQVNHVLNITDVGHLVSDQDEGQDKLEKTAKAQNKTAWDIAKHYTQVFTTGLSELNIIEPTHMPKATEFMQQQIDLIKKLEDKGFTYKIDDGIYFDTAKLEDYGKLAGLDLDGQEAGARIGENTQKKQPQDFALWKFSPKDQNRDMEWESPWGTGFPGWHVECSAMAGALLGETIDIHAGGIDHIPVHHTNEIAQSEAANGARFANIWVHGEFMNVDGEKMSKSKGNVYTLEQLKEKGFKSLDFRMLVLQAHYRTHQNFTWENLQAAQNRLASLQNLADLRFQLDSQTQDGDIDFNGFASQFKSTLLNDLNTPQALAAIARLQTDVDTNGLSANQSADFTNALQLIDQSFGLGLLQSSDISHEQKDLITERQQARDEKDFDKADQLRDTLNSQGLKLDDRNGYSLWSRN